MSFFGGGGGDARVSSVVSMRGADVLTPLAHLTPPQVLFVKDIDETSSAGMVTLDGVYLATQAKQSDMPKGADGEDADHGKALASFYRKAFTGRAMLWRLPVMERGEIKEAGAFRLLKGL